MSTSSRQSELYLWLSKNCAALISYLPVDHIKPCDVGQIVKVSGLEVSGRSVMDTWKVVLADRSQTKERRNGHP